MIPGAPSEGLGPARRGQKVRARHDRWRPDRDRRSRHPDHAPRPRAAKHTRLPHTDQRSARCCGERCVEHRRITRRTAYHRSEHAYAAAATAARQCGPRTGGTPAAPDDQRSAHGHGQRRRRAASFGRAPERNAAHTAESRSATTHGTAACGPHLGGIRISHLTVAGTHGPRGRRTTGCGPRTQAAPAAHNHDPFGARPTTGGDTRQLVAHHAHTLPHHHPFGARPRPDGDDTGNLRSAHPAARGRIADRGHARLAAGRPANCVPIRRLPSEQERPAAARPAVLSRTAHSRDRRRRPAVRSPHDPARYGGGRPPCGPRRPRRAAARQLRPRTGGLRHPGPPIDGGARRGSPYAVARRGGQGFSGSSPRSGEAERR